MKTNKIITSLKFLFTLLISALRFILVLLFNLLSLLLSPLHKYLQRFKAFKKLNRNSFTPISLILLLIVFSVGYYLLNPKSAKADWFNEAWNYRQKVPISNASGAAKTDFQTQITLDTSTLITAGKMQSDCADLRITDNRGKILPHWVEPTTCNTTTTLIWTKVPNIPTTGADLFAYYGNPSTSSGQADTNDIFIREMQAASVAWPMQETDSTQGYTQAYHPSDAQGRDIVINGTFASDTIWTKGSNWAIASGVATHTAGTTADLSQNNIVATSKSYELTFTISNRTAGTITPKLGTQAGTARSTNDAFTETIVSNGANLVFTPSSDFDGDIDDVSLTQVNIPASGDSDFDGTELLTDGDMEAADTSAWTAGNSATLSKQTTNPYQGSRVLRIVHGGSANPIAYQTIITIGKRYKVSGVARGDGAGNMTPAITDGSGSNLWTGTNSTSWQPFNFEYVAAQNNIRLYALGNSAGEYCEFDDVSVTEISPLSGSPKNDVTLATDSSGGHLSQAYTFDGTNDVVNIYSTELNSVLNPNAGTLVAWAKVSGSGVWTDGSLRSVVRLQVDNSNYILIGRHSANNYIYGRYYAGGTSKQILYATSAPTDWMFITITWDKTADEFKMYFNGAQVSSTLNGLGNWAGNLVSTGSTIGSSLTTPLEIWSGDINDVKLYDRALSANEIADLYDSSEDRQAYYTNNYAGYELVRQYDDTVTIGTLGTEEVGNGPIAYWGFNEGADNTCQGGEDACDSTENGNDGAFTGNPAWQSEDMCISGKCLYFDGSDDKINHGDILDSTFTDDFSVGFWFKANSVNAADYIDYMFFKSSSGNPAIPEIGIGITGGQLPANEGQVEIRHNTDAAYLRSTNTYIDNKWHHLKFTYDSNTNAAVLYIDGQVENSVTAAMSITSGADLILGGRGSVGRLFNGFLDEVKIYPYARTAAQVRSDYLAGVAGAGSGAVLGAADTSFLSNGLIGHWDMDESSGTAVADGSGNGNSGTLTNAQESGTSHAANSSTTVLEDDGTNADLSSTDDVYIGMILQINDDVTCALSSDEERVITDYNGTSKQITVGNAFSADLDSCPYTILHQVGGKYGNATSFDGENDYTDIYSSNLNTVFNGSEGTLSAWVNADSTAWSDNNFWSAAQLGADTSSNYVALGKHSSNQLMWRYEAGDDNKQILKSGTPSGWILMTLTWSVADDEVKAYYNGAQESTTATSLGTWSGSLNSATNVIGSRNTAPLEPWNGAIDDVRLYNRALTPSEVAALYSWAPGPVGSWNFDEGAGTTAHDKSGNSFNGSFTNSPTWAEGKYGGAVKFDPSDQDEVTVTDSGIDVNSGGTIEAWIKSNRQNNYPSDGSDVWRSIVNNFSTGNCATSGGGVALDWQGNNSISNLRASLCNKTNSQVITYSYNFEPETWYHVSLSWDGTTVKLFINGQEVKSQAQTIRPNDSNNDFQVGCGFGCAAAEVAWDGLLDEVKLYNYARTSAQILQDMKATSGSVLSSSTAGGVPHPVAHWSFDENQGQTAYDLIGSNNGTLGIGNTAASDDPTWITKDSGSCVNNGCLSFDGGDYVDIGDGPSAVNAISFWVNPSTTTEHIIDLNGTAYISASSGSLSASGFTSPTYYINGVATASPTISASTWTHVAVTTSTSIDASDLDIGRLEGTDNLTGYLDEIKVYNFALTANQVAQDYNANSTASWGNDQEAANLSDGAGNAPIAQWNFDEKNGSAVNDTSGNGNGGTISGASWASSNQCHEGGCLSFNGSSDVVNFGDLDDLTGDNYSYSFWVNVDSLSGYDALISKLDSPYNSGVLFLKQDDDLNLYIASSSITLNNNSFFTATGAWIYVTVVLDNGTVKTYKNGKLFDSGAYTAPADNDFDFLIGKQNSIGTRNLGGKIDEFKVYNYVRTPAQIAYDYNRGKPIAHYKMDECQGATIHDTSGNGYDGTLTITASGGNTNGIGTCETSTSAWGSGATGKYSSSVYFDGDGDYVDIGTGPSSIKTISAWIKPSSTTEYLVDLNGTDYLWINSGTLTAAGFTSPTYYINGIATATPTISASTWTHVVVTTGTAENASDLDIGRLEGTDNFDGQIDEVEIFNYALSAEQVKNEYNASSAIRFE